MAKKIKNVIVPKWLKSKYFVVGGALILAGGLMVSYSTFAHSKASIPTYCQLTVIKEGSTDSKCILAAQKALNRVCKQVPLAESGVWPIAPRGTSSIMTGRVKGYQASVPTTSDGVIGRYTWTALIKDNQYWLSHFKNCSVR
jgi:hypothetical protein